MHVYMPGFDVLPCLVRHLYVYVQHCVCMRFYRSGQMCVCDADLRHANRTYVHTCVLYTFMWQM